MAKKRVALITGITGQDGAYLAELLLEKGYIVHGMKRRSSSFNTGRIDHLINHNPDFHFHFGDMTDSTSLSRLIMNIEPDEVYNLAAQSHVKVSFEVPEYTMDTIAMGTIRLLEAIRSSGRAHAIKVYNAASSEMYGMVQETPQKETTRFYPRSPYGVAKVAAYYLCVNYREAYGMFICNGQLFNHESERRGETFVTRKITIAAAKIALGLQDVVYLGNLNAQRDWGYAKDFCRAMVMMLEQDKPDDYVISTGVTTTVREFAHMAFKEVGIDLEFRGEGLLEEGINLATGKAVILIDSSYFRPAEVDLLIGDSTKAHNQLKWYPHYTLKDIVHEMVKSDLQLYGKGQ